MRWTTTRCSGAARSMARPVHCSTTPRPTATRDSPCWTSTGGRSALIDVRAGRCEAYCRRYDLPMALSVLVVDDDPVILRLLQVNFELEGIGVVTAVDGEEGLKLAQSDPPDLVISDIMMPKVNGLELLAALRSSPDTASMPVI